MLFKLNRSVSSSYSHLAIVFFAMATVVTFVRGVFHDIFGDDYLTYMGPVVMPVGIFFLVFILRLVRNLGVSDRAYRFIVGLLIVSIACRMLSVFFIDDPQLKIITGVFSSTLLLGMQSTCVYFMCTNLFVEVNPIKEKLWASVCVYFMIGATFGTVYALLLTINPMGLGIDLAKPVEIYIVGLVYSFNVISGMDPVYDHASEAIRMTAVLESIFIMLFMVILIGRLLGSKD